MKVLRILKMFFLCIILTLDIGCEKAINVGKAPVLTTTSISYINNTSAQSGGNITDDGGSPIVSRGVCWNTSNSPTIANSKTVDGTGKGEFLSTLTDLNSNTEYFVRAYAINKTGISYGNEVSVQTIVDYIYDDGSGEQSWAIKPGYVGWLGNEFPVTSTGVIKTVKVYFSENLNYRGDQLHVDLFDQNHIQIGHTQNFSPATTNWLNIPVNNIPYDGKFYIMVNWNNTISETNRLREDLNGLSTSMDLAWYSDGTSWEKVSALQDGSPGVFLIRVTAEIQTSNGGKKLLEIGPFVNPDNLQPVNFGSLESIK